MQVRSDVTELELEALRQYIREAGPEWREQLRIDWMKAGSRHAKDKWHLLQGLRNRVGSKLWEIVDERPD